jgi:hypothetical protein
MNAKKTQTQEMSYEQPIRRICIRYFARAGGRTCVGANDLHGHRIDDLMQRRDNRFSIRRHDHVERRNQLISVRQYDDL